MRFKRVYIEIGNLCNLSCSFCSKLTRPPKQMSRAEFLHVVEEVRPYTDYVYFHVKGEPLVHPLLEEFLDICGEKNLQVNLTTNGTLLKRHREMLLSKKSLRQINISLHSFSAHEQPDYLETALSFVKEASLVHKKYAVLRLWNLDENREVDGGSLTMMDKIKSAFPGHDDLEERMTDHRSVMLEKGIFISWEQEFVWPKIANPFVSEEGICLGMRHMVGILADGTVVPCCLDADGEAPLGNLFQTPFSAIVEGDNFRKIAGAFTNRKVLLPLCQHCNYRTRFDGGAILER